MAPADAAARLARRILLGRVRRGTPWTPGKHVEADAMKVAAWAASVSAAYRVLLVDHGIDLRRMPRGVRWQDLPVLTKAATFGRFALPELSRSLQPGEIADVLTSSGRSGQSFGFRLSARREHERSWFAIDLGLQDAFNVDGLATLLVNCLPMGVVFRSRAVAVANVSVREDMACAILRDIGPRFDQTILCTDPVFIRRILDEADQAGVDWTALNTSVILGEETLAESQRDFIAAAMGIDCDVDQHRTVASSFGVGELGLNLLFESRETIRIRRAARRNGDLARLLGITDEEPDPPLVFCYSPFRMHVEVPTPGADGYGELAFTMLGRKAVIPLPRFASGDVGRVLTPAEVTRAAAVAGVAAPWLPVVLLRGRAADRTSGVPSIESIKQWLYENHGEVSLLTGLFRLSPAAKPAELTLTLQAREGASEGQRQGLEAGLQRRRPASWPSIALKVVSAEAFPGRLLADYERKPSYRFGFGITVV